ncbi:hypothetical protein V502_04426 [Pseudogymnoascus sp. VKM F-4520 (FW-2644)]|nr:hypothetical protein V502_04426 [Pseudogymnoascus sp. VKM F-4520 (FW-2644)]
MYGPDLANELAQPARSAGDESYVVTEINPNARLASNAVPNAFSCMLEQRLLEQQRQIIPFPSPGSIGLFNGPILMDINQSDELPVPGSNARAMAIPFPSLGSIGQFNGPTMADINQSDERPVPGSGTGAMEIPFPGPGSTTQFNRPTMADINQPDELPVPGSSAGAMTFPEQPPPPLVISDLLRSDLDQLYFERSHPFVPILNQRQYFSRAKKGEQTESQKCLQYAMWTIASCLSAQLQQIRASLYECTRQMLESLESNNNNTESTDIEHVQARVLLFIYEFMYENHQRAWINAGRCFRYVQLLRLYEIDSAKNVQKRSNELDTEDWIKIEEKRRTFWMAYSLDRFISIRHEWPLTLNEQISTRLPIPEEEFQRGQYLQMGFLSEAIASTDQNWSSPFTESIILATICGRALAHGQQSAVEHVYGNVPEHFWDRHEWLDMMLMIRSNNLLQNYLPATQHVDCMLLFTRMMAPTAVLYLCKVIESVAWETEEYSGAIAEFKQRSLVAAQEVVGLTRSISHLSYFKVHPFTPLPLGLCVEFFNAHRHLDEFVNKQAQEILQALNDLSTVNNLARDYLSSLSIKITGTSYL